MHENKKIRIAVLDSGLDKESTLAQKMDFEGGREIFLGNEGEIEQIFDAVDDIGHGTAVASLINKLNPDVEIIPIKIVRNGVANSTEILITALSLLANEKCCDIINISAGIVTCDNINGLLHVCKRLTEQGVIIVAAFDSEGAVSYPAAFDCVIGVDGFRLDRNINGYYRCGVGDANYIASMREQRLPWLNQKLKTVSGTSFIAPQFTAKIAKMLMKQNLSFTQIVAILNEQATGSVEEVKYPKQSFDLNIQRAVVFPFNKEMHSLARFEDMLGFAIDGYYDTKYSGQVGLKISELQKIDNNLKKVQNIDCLDWNGEFDTVILGHTSLLSNAVGRDFETEIIQKCEKYKKKLFSCRDIRDKNPKTKYYVPCVDKLQSNGKIRRMHVFGCPILGIVGTGTKQGKFSLQLSLRRELLKQGYNVGQLGTEPTAQLFGMDAVYPMGHESATYVQGFDAVFAVNQLMGHIEEKNPDIILFGSQSHTVTYIPGGPSYYPVCQHELLLGCQADAYILVVCMDNPISYIQRTILFLQSLLDSKVIALAVSPLTNSDRWSTVSSRLELIDNESQKDFCQCLREKLNLPVFSIQTDEDIKTLSQVCLEYFS